jgi:hypothetical protein
MSIVASVKVYDGIVIGAESMTQLFGNLGAQAQYIKSYQHAQKIFQIANLPVGALTYGGGNIGNRSMESFVHEFSQSERMGGAAPAAGVPLIPEGPKTVEAIATRLLAFLRNHYDHTFGSLPEPQRPVIGFFLAGYSPNEPLASEWEFILPQAQTPVRARPDALVGASWRGVGIPFSRLFFGVDPRTEQMLAGLGVPQQTIAAFKQLAQQQLTSRMAFDGMPIQDAIAFCKFIIDTTIGMATYEIGVPSCGGPVNIAVITRNGFEWVSKPKFTLSTVQG